MKARDKRKRRQARLARNPLLVALNRETRGAVKSADRAFRRALYGGNPLLALVNNPMRGLSRPE